MTQSSAADAALAYYYDGFFRALRHHRAGTIAGWIIAAIGCAGVFSSCRAGGEPFSTGVSLCAAAAGIALVYQSIVRLDAYVAIPFPPPDPAIVPAAVLPLLTSCEELMREVEHGGWHEAYAALGALRTLTAGPDGDVLRSMRGAA